MRTAILLAGSMCLSSVASVASAQDQATPPAPPLAPAPVTTPAPTPSSTPSVPETGFELGARLGFSVPFGQITQGVEGAMPLWIDAGRRFSKQLVLGVYGYAAVAFPVVGAGYGFGFGGEGQYFLSQPILGLNPWVGAGFGYLVANVSFMGSTTTIGGPEGGVQLGLDYKNGFGPYAGFTVGSYSGQGVDEWITIGMRGTYDW